MRVTREINARTLKGPPYQIVSRILKTIKTVPLPAVGTAATLQGQTLSPPFLQAASLAAY